MTDGLDRDAVARILGRAQEIESVQLPSDSGGVDEVALVEAAVEVGIDANAVRDSIAIERLSILPAEEHRLDRLGGPMRLVVEREIYLPVDTVLGLIEEWMGSRYRLVVDRRSASMLMARRRTDVSAKLGRVITTAQGEGRLALSSVSVEAIPQVTGSTPERPRSIVRLSADRSAARATRLAGGGVIGAGGVGMGATAAALGGTMVLMPIVAAPLVAGGLVVARSGRWQADRLELELERLLSRVERGERPVGLLSRVARRARKATGR